MGLEIFVSTYRDGSLHPETWLVSFLDKFEDELICHAIEDRFYTACGKSFWGKPSSAILGDPNRVECPECRQLLSGARFAFDPIQAPEETLAVAS